MSHSLVFADTPMELHGEGAVWFPEHRLLCASDMHFEKGTFFQRFATLLPPYDTKATLLRLEELILRFKPKTFVSLGDGFHDVQALERMHYEDRALLNLLIASVEEWIWVEGNHDPVIAGELGGHRCAIHQRHGMVFRHISEPGCDEWELSGHYHPKARISIQGHAIRAPCFVKSGTRLILPAFGSYTGGLDVDHPVLETVMPKVSRELFLLRDRRVFPWRE